MESLTAAPRILGWLPIVTIVLAVVAAAIGTRFRGKDDAPDGARRAAPFALLFIAAILAVISSVAETAIDSRVGIREASMFGLALVCGTPAIGWLLARARWGTPGRRTFHQQIAANQANATVLAIVLGEVLALTGFVVGATLGAMASRALTGGLAFATLSVLGALVAVVVTMRRGSGMLLGSIGALPIDNRHGVLKNVVAELSMAAGMEPPELYVIADAAPNAFAVGSDVRHASIAVTTGLLERLDREELQGVIAHELAHIRNLDSRYGLLIAVFVGAVILLAAAFAAFMRNWSIRANGLSGLLVAIVVAIIAAAFGWLVKTIATTAALAIQASVSREREFLADASSVALIRNPAGLIRALATISTATAVKGTTANTRHLWFVSPVAEDQTDTEGWRSTHPAVAERISRLRALGGELDQERPPSDPGPGDIG